MSKKQQTLPVDSSSTIQRHASDSDISSKSETSKASAGEQNIIRHKRRRVDDSLNDSLSTMKKDLMELIDNKLDNLNANMKDHNAEVNKALEFMTLKYDDIKVKYEDIQRERKADKIYIQELENKIESMDKTNRASTIEIRNVPRKSTETKSDLAVLAVNLGRAIDLDINNSEIVDVYRVNLQTKADPPLIVKLTTVLRKEEFIRAVKTYNKQHSSQLSTAQLKLGLPPSPIYVSEHMTAKTRRLFFLARDFARTNNYRFCWCAHGRIFIRKKEGTAPLLIKEENQLAEFNKQADMSLGNPN